MVAERYCLLPRPVLLPQGGTRPPDAFGRHETNLSGLSAIGSAAAEAQVPPYAAPLIREPLTPAEHHVLSYVCAGYSNKKLSIAQRTQLLSLLVEGNGIRPTSRITGFSTTTVLKFLADVGRMCSIYQDKVFRNLSCKRLQCDEIWSFVGAKEKNATKEHKAQGWGDAWTWTAIDCDTKLIPCWFVGERNARAAHHFMHDLADRIASRVQLTTDGLKAYIGAVDSAFGNDIDFAQLVKIYGDVPADQVRYSPAQCMGTKKTVLTGSPSKDHISTSYIERANLTMRMHMRRFTRLTNAHSKKLENHEHAIALHFFHYNFCKIHQTLRVTPAMAAGLAERVWELEDVAEMLDLQERLAA